jgi:hypothetical protein
MGALARATLEDVLDLARKIADELEPLTRRPLDPDALALRLAQAHALGLVDQLSDVVARRDVHVRDARRDEPADRLREHRGLSAAEAGATEPDAWGLEPDATAVLAPSGDDTVARAH